MKTTLAKLIACLALTGTTVAIAAPNVITLADANTMGQANVAIDKSLATLDVDEIEGKDILDATGRQLGDVDEVVTSKNNQTMAVIGLEDSDKEVAVPLSSLSLSADGKNLTTRLSKTELMAMPDYDPMDMQSVEEEVLVFVTPVPPALVNGRGFFYTKKSCHHR
ncbi:MAG TPA: PRC-barrel domain-containing protein [Halioglobus sp.]